MSTPVFVIAQQRSGTNLLRKSLAATNQFKDADEIFDPRKNGFWQFSRTFRAAQKLESGAENRVEIFEAFIDQVRQCEQPFVLLDIKYNSMHNLNGQWHSPIANDTLLDWIIDSGYPVIHLVRENCLENYVSYAVAMQNRVWVLDADTPPPPVVRLNLDPNETIQQVVRRKNDLRRFRHLLSKANLLELRYKELIDDGSLNKIELQRLADFLGMPETIQATPSTGKTGRPIRDVVANLDSEIGPALKQCGLGSYLPPAETSKTADDSHPVFAYGHRPFLINVPRINREPFSSQPVFVFSYQNSGSNLIREQLSRLGSFHDFGELFANPNRHEGYWQHKWNKLASSPDICPGSRQGQLALFESFLEKQLDHATPFTLFSVRYNVSHQLNSAWYRYGSRPLLLEWLIEQKIPMLHVVRPNLLESYLRNLKSFLDHSRPDLAENYSLNASEMLLGIERIRERIYVAKRWVKEANLLELEFNRTINNRDNDVGLISEFLGLELPKCVEFQNPEPSIHLSWLRNFESELVPALYENGFGNLVECLDWTQETGDAPVKPNRHRLQVA